MHPNDSQLHRRRSIRLEGYDYSSPGAYFVTLVTWQRDCILGTVEVEKVQLSRAGEIAAILWRDLERKFGVEIDQFVVMPNHLHGILWINDPHVANGRGEASGLKSAFGQPGMLPDASPQRETGNPGTVGRRISLPGTATSLDGGRGEASGRTFCLRNAASNPDASPLRNRANGTVPGSLGAILQNYKAVTARKINGLWGTSGKGIWQRNYYEHIIRSEDELKRIREYILANPVRWGMDEENPVTARGKHG